MNVSDVEAVVSYVAPHQHSLGDVVGLEAELISLRGHYGSLGKEVDGLRNDIKGLHFAILVLVSFCLIFGITAIILIG